MYISIYYIIYYIYICVCAICVLFGRQLANNVAGVDRHQACWDTEAVSNELGSLREEL